MSFLFKNNKMGYRLVKNRKELINTGKIGIVILRKDVLKPKYQTNARQQAADKH